MITTPTEEMSLDEIPVRALRSKTREKLMSMLNQRKLILSPEGLYRDYRGLAALMDLPVDNYWTPNYNNPIASLLERSRHFLADLQKFLEQIDRYDVLDDTRAQFREDAIAWCDSKNQIVRSWVFPDETNLLTIDDIYESGILYDAFLLYEDSDMQFAAEIFRTLKSYNLKICVKDRLLGGTFEHSAVMKLISNRCRRLIVLLSDEFVSSDKNTFILDFAQYHGLGTRKRFVVPVKYKPCTLPEHYLIYFILDHMRDGVLSNFWERLHASVIHAQETNHDAHKAGLLEINSITAGPVNSSQAEQNLASKPAPSTPPRKTVRSKLSKFLKRVSRKKPKNLPRSEPVACAS